MARLDGLCPPSALHGERADSLWRDSLGWTRRLLRLCPAAWLLRASRLRDDRRRRTRC